MAFYDSNIVRGKIAEERANATTLVELAKAEEREPTEAEDAAVQLSIDTIGVDDPDSPTGLYAELRTALRYEAMVQASAHEAVPPVPAPAAPRAPAVHKPRGTMKAFGDDYDGAYKTGKWLLAIAGDRSAEAWCESQGLDIRGAMSTGDNAKGGFLVPAEASQRIIDLREMYGVFRQNCDIEPMGSDSKTIPRRASGVTAYHVGEGTAVTDSDIKFGQVELVAKVFAALTKISSVLLDDEIYGLADRVVNEMAWAFAKKEDEAGFTGTGISTDGGITGITVKIDDGNHTAGVIDAASGNTAFSTLDLLDFENMIGALPQFAMDGAAWYISQVGWAASMLRLQNAAGGNAIDDIGRGPERMFMGFPVRISQVLNTTTAADTDAIGLLFGNLALSSTLGDRNDFSAQVLNELYAANMQVGILGHTRFAINNHDLGDTSTAGPIVALAKAAS